MNGHFPIIEMRKRKIAPSIVFVNDWDCKTDWAEWGESATVSICPTEPIETLDLRFLVGLRVSVSSDSEKRAKALFNACKQAGARTVAATHNIPVTTHRVTSGWTEVWHG